MKYNLFNEFDQKDNFYVRIREGKSSEVYYNGIKPFIINNNKLTGINARLFKCNRTNISNSNEDDLINCLRDNRNRFYDLFELRSINFEKGNEGFKNEKKFNDTLKKLGAIEIKNNEYEIDGKNLSIEDEYRILNNIWVDSKIGNSNLFRKVVFKWDTQEKELTLEEIKEYVPKLIKDYFEYTRPEIEKYYQHLFLLDKDLKSLRKENMFSNNNVKPFEEEYYIDEKKQDGRIDCVFYKEMNGYITDIYLIEIKVDTDVIGNSNGLHKHLLDILHIDDMNNDFFETLIKRINYRNKVLYGKEELKVAKNLEKHFFIVIGRNNSSLKEIENSIIDLSIEKSTLYKNVRSKMNNKYKNEIEPLSKIYAKCSKGIEVKLFVDQNKWNVSDNFEPDYEDFTKWLKDDEK